MVNGAKNFIVIKWGASSRWSSSLYCLMRNSGRMTIGKTRSTLSLKCLMVSFRYIWPFLFFKLRSFHLISVILVTVIFFTNLTVVLAKNANLGFKIKLLNFLEFSPFLDGIMKIFGFRFSSRELYWNLNLFVLFALARNIEPANLDFLYLGLENLFLMFMVYRMGLIGQFINYVNSKAVRSFRLEITIYFES